MALLVLIFVFLVTDCVSAYDLTLLHTNHIHAHFEEFNSRGLPCTEDESLRNECFGGIARRMTKVNEIRSENPNTILLDGGDHFQGTQWFTHYRGYATAHFMNKIRYDAMAPSNHEFDLGPGVFADFLEEANFPVVSCNMNVSRIPEMLGQIEKSVVLVIGGEEIGIVGYTTTKTHLISPPGDVTITDEITALRDEVERLTSQGINKIIVLGTSGLSKEMKIARKVPGVDVIVGADHHHFLYKGVPTTDRDDVTRMYPLVIKPDEDSDVLIVQTTNFGKYLSYLQMTFDEEGKITHFSGNPILLNSSITQDPDTLAEVEAWANPIRALGGDVVGRSYSFLEGTNPSCRARECNLGNLLTDAFLWEHVQFQEDNGWSDVSIAMMNSGGIRKSISAGDIEGTDVTDVLPFGNTIDVVEIKGRNIVEILERSIQEYDPVILPGFFLQYSGLIVVYDVTQPPGSRVVSVLVRCTFCAIPNYEVLEMRKTYKVVMPSYLANGGDGFSMIPEHTLSRSSGRQDAVVVTDYLRQHSPIAPGPEKRIRILGYTSPLGNFCR